MKTQEDLRSEAAKKYRKWYKSRRWQSLRKEQLARHPFCQCPGCKGSKVEADTVDHIKPHYGDARLFWNPRNLQSMTSSCHSRAKQSFERTGVWPGHDERGWPMDRDAAWHERGGGGPQ